MFNGTLVKSVGKVFGEDVADILPYAYEKNRVPMSVPPYHELIAAAMYAHRCYQDETGYETAIRYLAERVPESNTFQGMVQSCAC